MKPRYTIFRYRRGCWAVKRDGMVLVTFLTVRGAIECAIASKES